MNMSQPITYISSDPNGLLSAPIGSFFYRRDQRYFLIDEVFGREEQVYTVSLSVFAGKKYNSDFYKNKVFAFSEPIETWQKVTNSRGVKMGWKFISNSPPTFKGNHSIQPTPTPTPTPTENNSTYDVLIVDGYNHALRIIRTSGYEDDGIVTTITGPSTETGSADGGPSVARFSGNMVFNSKRWQIPDTTDMWFFDNQCIRSVGRGGTSPLGEVTTRAGSQNEAGYVDGSGSVARFNFTYPNGLSSNISTVSSPGDNPWQYIVIDTGNNCIRGITQATGTEVPIVGTFVGSPTPGHVDGSGSEARFGEMSHAAYIGDNMYVNDWYEGVQYIRMVTPRGEVTTVCTVPERILQMVGADGVIYVVADAHDNEGTLNWNVYQITDTFDVGLVETWTYPWVIARSGYSTTLPRGVWVLDKEQTVMYLWKVGGHFTGVAGVLGEYGVVDGVGPEARMGRPPMSSPTPTPTETEIVPTPTETPTPTPTLDNPPVLQLEYMISGSWSPFSFGDSVIETNLPEGTWSASFQLTNVGGGLITLSDSFGIEGTTGSDYLQSYISPPSSVTLSGGESVTFEFYNSSNWFTHVAGNLHIGSDLMGDSLIGFDLSYDTSSLLQYTMSYADTRNSIIRVVNGAGVPRESFVNTVAGIPTVTGSVDGTGQSALLNNPVGVRVSWNEDPTGLYFCDGNAIRRSTLTGEVSTIAGNVYESGSTDGIGTDARFDHPSQCYLSFDDSVYVADTVNHAVRRVDLVSGEVTTLAGQLGTYGQVDGVGIDARFYNINSITQGDDGALYVTENAINVGEEHRLRRISLDGTTTTLRGWVNGTDDRPVNSIGVDGWVYVYFESGNVCRVSFDGSLNEDCGFPGVYPVCRTSNWSGMLGFRGYELVQWIPNASGVILPQAGNVDESGYVDGTGSIARFDSITPI